jgi:predicted phosphodiesterase
MLIGFLADIHEDIVSLRAAVAALDEAGCDVLVCLGDITGFSYRYQCELARRDANACIDLLRKRCAAVVAGNHDLFTCRRIPEYAAGFAYPDNWYAMSEEARVMRADGKLWRYSETDLPQRLTTASRSFLAALPEFRILQLDGTRVLFTHFAYPDLSGSRIESLLEARTTGAHLSFMAAQNCTLAFSGHGHPEGYAYSVGGELRFGPFGSWLAGDGAQWIVCPAVARTDRLSGVLCYDTRSRRIDVLTLTA